MGLRKLARGEDAPAVREKPRGAIQRDDDGSSAADDLDWDAFFGEQSVEKQDRSVKMTAPQMDRRGGKSAKRWEDNKLQVVVPAARCDLSAKSVQENGSYSSFDISDSSDFDSVAEYWAKHKDCAVAAYATLDRMGYKAPIGDKNSVLKRGEIGRSENGHLLDLDREAAMKILDHIDLSLAEGFPVMMGVDYPAEQHASNTDGVTDHWIIVTNRTHDPKTGEVRYEAIDNASTEYSHRTFTVGEDYGLRSDPPEGVTASDGIAQLPYTATNVRVPERKP